MAKTVCIIGAGPSGLVAAKTLTHDHKGSFHVTVFEQLHRIGGLWPLSDVDDGMVNPDMCTNQSKHTVSFSDLAWPEASPSFPKAWEVGQYLERYVKTYPGYGIRLNTKVLRSKYENGKWQVQVEENLKQETETLDFDHMIVSTGFFGKSKIPEGLEDANVPVWHSSKIRDVQDLLTDGGTKKASTGKNIVVVGGQMSGVETAASIAFQISSAANTPGESSIKDADLYTVYNIIQKPLWIMPLFFPKNPEITKSDDAGKPQPSKKNKSPEFLPLDLVNYNLSWRPPGPVQNTSGHIEPDSAKMVHGFMETYIGDDQSGLGTAHLSMSGEHTRSEPPMLACGDQYTEFVRAKKIKIVKGKLTETSYNESTTVRVENRSEVSEIPDVAAIVCATGFDASPSVSFLPEEMLELLQFLPTDDGFPLALNNHATVSKKIPSLGFVGFYRSPYWGVMEMQARFLAKLWSGDAKTAQALADDTTIDSMLKMRDDPRRSQFPMGDYAYLMESFSEILGIKRLELDTTPPDTRTGIVLPARYIYETSDEVQKQESSKALQIIDGIFEDSSTKGKFTARAVFRAVQGIWHLRRHIDSKLDTFPSGELRGTASFLPRSSTNEDAEMEYLYLEEGEFKTNWGGTMSAKRSYVYHYSEATDKMDVWFTKPDYKTSDYFFHQLEFSIPDPNSASFGDEGWKAKSSHLCIDDLYNVTYEFKFKGTVIESWTSRYLVKGPKKDYTINNVYSRHS